MRPTFSDGQIVVAQTIGASAKFDRGDVITFFPYEDSGITYIKRIIGLPGETIQSSGDIVKRMILAATEKKRKKQIRWRVQKHWDRSQGGGEEIR